MFMISVTRRRYWKLVAVLLAAYSGIASVAAAEIDAAPPQQVVRFGDLNLRDSRGAAAVYGRLVWAARHVCAGADSADHWVRQGANPCILQAVSRAIESIGAPELTTYAQAQALFRARPTEMIAVSH
jgi:UrcA family protein